jgi:DNA-binding NtrC family response regulator
MEKILVVDDEKMIRMAFEAFLLDEGYLPLLAGNAQDACLVAEREQPAVIFLDFRMPEIDGLAAMAELQQAAPEAVVIFMTAFGTLDVAIAAMQQGAYEYLIKPLDLQKIRELLINVLRDKRVIPESESGGGPSASVEPRLIGGSPCMQELFKTIAILTMREVTVLITGESGVGKELVALAIHEKSSRRDDPFIAINCGAIPENLLESELFGHESGAFTGADGRKIGKFETAKNGTVFLDEIAELPLSMQVKLLRVLQENSFYRVGGNTLVETHARVVAATNRNLTDEITAGRFRQDLYYRLHLIHVEIPPLRARKEDIPLLVQYFIAKGNREFRLKVRGVTENALKSIMEYAWPGNVRQLENQIKQAMVLARGEFLGRKFFKMADGDDFVKPPTDPSLRNALVEFMDGPQGHGQTQKLMQGVIVEVEKVLLLEALKRNNNNQVKAAQYLGMHRSSFRNKLQEYGL